MTIWLQSILFDKNIYTLEEAKKWIIIHGYIPHMIKVESKKLRFRIGKKKKFDYFRSKKVGEGITLVFGIYRCRGKKCLCSKKVSNYDL